MSELVEFLLARITEDEADAHQLAIDLGRREREKAINGPDGSQGSIIVASLRDGTAMDPERLLAECGAKRALLAEAQMAMSDGTTLGCHLIRLLALPYADHPDYRQPWRP